MTHEIRQNHTFEVTYTQHITMQWLGVVDSITGRNINEATYRYTAHLLGQRIAESDHRIFVTDAGALRSCKEAVRDLINRNKGA